MTGRWPGPPSRTTRDSKCRRKRAPTRPPHGADSASQRPRPPWSAGRGPRRVSAPASRQFERRRNEGYVAASVARTSRSSSSRRPLGPRSSSAARAHARVARGEVYDKEHRMPSQRDMSVIWAGVPSSPCSWFPRTRTGRSSGARASSYTCGSTTRTERGGRVRCRRRTTRR